jgi:60 kDa SS-A/Ro ribonucleoprotein
VLAIGAAYGDSKTKALAAQNLDKVARIGTHILHFADYANSLRGWGRSLKRAVANWYLSKTPEQVGFHAGVKYRQREGWSHKDVLRLSHVKAKDESMNAVLNYLVKGWKGTSTGLPASIVARELLHANPSEAAAIKYINEQGLPREAIPTELLNNVNVWKALFKDMPLRAMIRNLNKMTQLGILKPLGIETAQTVARLTNVDELKKARIHPMQLLFAHRTYSSGQGDKGKLVWNPVPEVVAALEKAFYLSFANVNPTGKRFLFGIDISGSMDGSKIAGSNVSAKDAAMCLALVTAKVEPKFYAVAFDHDPSKGSNLGGGLRQYGRSGCRPIEITLNSSLAEMHKIGGKWLGGGTDTSQPILEAIEKNLEVDAFVMITDSECYQGTEHTCVVLNRYRQKTGIPARMIVIGMTSNGFSISDPTDALSMDIVGFDSSTPEIISSFARGDF